MQIEGRAEKNPVKPWRAMADYVSTEPDGPWCDSVHMFISQFISQVLLPNTGAKDLG